MEKIEGVLDEYGDSMVYPNGESVFSYIVIGGQTLTKVRIVRGLEGKFANRLGEKVTVYLASNFIWGFTAADGKNYCVDLPLSYGKYIFGIVAAITGICWMAYGDKVSGMIALCIGLIPIYLGYARDELLLEIRKLPNVIKIPMA
jgi:hypothetical protein